MVIHVVEARTVPARLTVAAETSKKAMHKHTNEGLPRRPCGLLGLMQETFPAYSRNRTLGLQNQKTPALLRGRPARGLWGQNGS